jgi:hypothetical protein
LQHHNHKYDKKMKNCLLIALTALLVLSSCSTTEQGAYVGGQFGHVIGSAIGGITGGGRGHDWGALIGTMGGVVAGAAIGNGVEKSNQQKYEEHLSARRTLEARRAQDARQALNERKALDSTLGDYDDSGYDPQGQGDDRISFESEIMSPLEIRYASINETIRDGVLSRGEQCTVRFEIMNTSDRTVLNVRPLVEDVTGNKHVKISPNLMIESIAPHQGVRYTATIVADKHLKDGEIQVMVGVAEGLSEIKSQTRLFTVPTAKTAR